MDSGLDLSKTTLAAGTVISWFWNGARHQETLAEAVEVEILAITTTDALMVRWPASPTGRAAAVEPHSNF